MTGTAPADGEVKIWLAHPATIKAPDHIARYRAMLTETERAAELRFKIERVRHEFLITRALVRTTLARCLDLDPAELRFVINRHGRPRLDPWFDSPFRFNLSHTDGLIACAVSRGLEIGVDVEATDRRGALLDIANRYFAARELKDLNALPADQRRERFFVYWTLKESYIKARGMGLALPLGEFAFAVGAGQGEPIRIAFSEKFDDDSGAWQFWFARPTHRHRLALAVQRGVDAADVLVTLERVTVP